MHWAKAQIESDAFDRDNRAYVKMTCARRERVLLVGDKRDFGLVPAALAPAGDGTLSGLDVVTARGTKELAASADAPACMAVMTWEAAASADDRLRAYVETGATVLIVPAAGRPPSERAPPAWIGARPGSRVRHDPGFPLMVFDRTAAFPAGGEIGSRDDPLAGVKAFEFFPLLPGDDTRALAGLEDGRVLLALREPGRGRVYTSGVAFEPGASTLPLKATFLALLQEMALARRGEAAAPASIPAGGRPQAVGGNGPVQIRSVAGGPLDWTGSAGRLPRLVRAGVYRVEDARGVSYVAVRPDPREGEARYTSGGVLPALAPAPHHVAEYTEPEALVRMVQRRRTGTALFPLFLLAMIAAMLTESWVVNPRPRDRRHVGKGGRG
jgi:hypothetical protein